MPDRRLGDQFMQGVAALLGALPVEQIASLQIASCQPGDELTAVLSNSAWATFDTLGVRSDDGTVRHVLWKSRAAPVGIVAQQMEVLRPETLLDPGASLLEAIRELVGRKAVFIGHGGCASGIITPSDLLKMPVRLLCFAFVAHLEIVLGGALRWACGDSDDKWKKYLTDYQRKKLARELDGLRKAAMDPSPIDALDFSSKQTAIAGLLGLPDKYSDDLTRVRGELRNPVAHARPFVKTEADVERLLMNLRSAFHWSQVLRKGDRLVGAGSADLESIGKALFDDGWEQERQSWDDETGRIDWSPM